MNENKAHEDLEFIKNIIAESKQSVVFGNDFIIWGVLVALSLITTYILSITGYGMYIKWLWVGSISIGWIYQAIVFKTAYRPIGAKTFIDKIIGRLWVATGICATTVAFMGMFVTNFGMYISPLICSFLTVAYFVTGELLKKTTWRYLAAGWWLCAVVMFLFPGKNSIIIMAVGITCLQIIPGITIRKNALEKVRN